MRSLIADAVVAMTGVFLRWMDPTVSELHIARVRRPLGSAFPLPDLGNTCRPRGMVPGYDLTDHERSLIE